ncbi:MAG: glycosyltransferase family A protein, partial [Nanoarchaeota archaeon]
MHNASLVTVITPTYNRIKSLKQAIDCVQKQTYPYWEHLIVADGHDFRVEKLVKAMQDPRVKYFYTKRTKDLGGSQRNHALRKAKGQLMAYLDDDNLMHKDYLKEMVKKFHSRKIGYA